MKVTKKLQRGEIATFLTIISAFMMIAGIITGSVINQQGTRTTSRAAGCAGGEWECAVSGKPIQCANADAQAMFNGTWCDGAQRWKWEAAGETNACGGSIDKLKPPDGNCSNATPTSAPSGNCPAGQWKCTINNVTRCSDDIAKGEFIASWCDPEQRWQYETAKNLGGNGSECNGIVSRPLPNCFTATPTSAPSGTCPSGQWKCSFSGNTYCGDEAAKDLFNANWCEGEKRWLWESAGYSDKCGGKASVSINAPECKNGVATSITPSPIPSPTPNATKAPNPGGFHLTSDIYAEKTSNGIKFNVHVLFNFDGCDGDISLFRDGTKVAGFNSWKGPGAFDYNQEWAGSFEVKKSESVSPGYEGTVDRCPKSSVTLRDNISCEMSVDGNGVPGVAGTGCTFKNKSEFGNQTPPTPAPTTPPRPYAGDCANIKSVSYTPSGALDGNQAFTCQATIDQADSNNIACGWSKNGGWPLTGGRWENVGCKGTDCSFGIQTEKDIDKNATYELVAFDARWNCGPNRGMKIPLQMKGVTPIPTQKDCDNACCGKPDGYSWNGEVEEQCDGKNWVIISGVCQNGKIKYQPGCATCDKCDSSKDTKPRSVQAGSLQKNACTPGGGCNAPITPIPGAGTPSPTITPGGPSLTPSPTPRGGGPIQPTLPLNQKTKFIYHIEGIDCWIVGSCRHEMQGTKATFETAGVAPAVESLVEEAWGGPGVGFKIYTKDLFFTSGRAYTAKIVTTYTDKQKPGMTCIHTDFAPPPPKTIDATTTQWDVWGKLTPDTDCSTAPPPTPAPGAGNMRDLDVVYHVTGVCKVWAVCDQNYKNANWSGSDSDIRGEVWYKIADSGTPPAYISLVRDYNFSLNPLDPYIDLKKFKVPFQIGKTYKGSASFKYKNKDTLCIAYKDETKSITGVDTEFRFDYSLNPSVDCTNPPDKPSLLQGSSNQDLISVIDKYTKGEIGAKEVSTFISQLNRSPFQPVFCTCPGGNCSQCTGPVYPAQGEEDL